MGVIANMIDNNIYDGVSWADPSVQHEDVVLDVSDEQLLDKTTKSLVNDKNIVREFEGDGLMSNHFSDKDIVRSGIHDVDDDKNSFSSRIWNRFKFIPNGQFIVGSAREITDRFTEIPEDMSFMRQNSAVVKDRSFTVDADLGISETTYSNDIDLSC